MVIERCWNSITTVSVWVTDVHRLWLDPTQQIRWNARTNEFFFIFFLFFFFFFTSFHNEIENQMPSIILERQLHAAKGTRHWSCNSGQIDLIGRMRFNHSIFVILAVVYPSLHLQMASGHAELHEKSPKISNKYSEMSTKMSLHFIQVSAQPIFFCI